MCHLRNSAFKHALANSPVGLASLRSPIYRSITASYMQRFRVGMPTLARKAVVLGTQAL